MTIYFYDESNCSIIALDTETKSARLLPQAMLTPEPILRTGEHQPAKAPPKAPKGSSAAPRKSGEACEDCGSKGRRHKKGCPLAGASTEPSRPVQRKEEKNKREYMSQMTFGRVKISQSHGVDADSISRNLSVPAEEVEKAFRCETYHDYRTF